MKTDIAKVSFDELKHFVGVYHQMGRLPLESDFNEQSDLMLRLVQRIAGDAMQTGSPNLGFHVDTRVLLDTLSSRRGWTPTPATAVLFVDYFNRRVGDGSLVSIGATAIARKLDAPLDLSQAQDVLIALKADPAAACTFYVGDGTSTHAFTMTDLYTDDDDWRIVRATPGAWPAGFGANAIVEYGFTGMAVATRYAFDFLKADLPLRSLLVNPELADHYSALPANAVLSTDDDHRLWGCTSLQASAATQVTCTFSAPQDCSRARKLLVAVQSSPAAAALTVTLMDDATPALTLSLSGAALSTVGNWRIMSFSLPQAGAFNWGAVTALRYATLDATANYTLGPVLLEADPALDLVVMGGDGTSAGAGRFYGEGLAAVKEAHGTYFTQTDLPQADPAALAAVTVGKRRIDWAYLDLWERPLTYVERAELRDVALDGDDSCTRRQLVAQVRLLKGQEVAFASTAAPPADTFAMLPRWGHGVLSTKDKPAATLDPCADPCEPAIAGPYLGEDNRLFRVEIHRAGNIGAANLATTAQFKWSRQNGALTSGLIADAAVGDFSVQVEKPELYAVGDVIEIADDLIELITGAYEDRVNHKQHKRGELRRVVTVNLQTRRLSWQDPSIVDPNELPFHTALPRGMRMAYHAKVTQWDGVAAVTPGDLVLADGVVIEFGGSDLGAGDYWQFATRTADRSVERLIEAPPRGTLHAYYPLAAIHRARENMASTEIVFAEDLRPSFTALPQLDASRIAYDPGAGAADTPISGWADVSTVQQAIDALARADLTGDMKLHNQLLHGMGVICGLKLRCAKDRTRIILGKGYALECDGSLLHQSGEEDITIVDMATNQGLLDISGNGEVNLWIEQGTSGLKVQIEPYVPQTFWQSVLEGSLLKDFWDKYVLDLVTFLKAQLWPFPATTLPLPDSHKLVISLLNLIWQKINSASGPYMFVSAAEHKLLEDFHTALLDKLAPIAYCALFDTLTVFPSYPYGAQPGIDTMFGMVLMHRRMKLVPGDKYLVTYGTGNKIQVFDTAARSAVLVTEFPGGSNVLVRDVAFNTAGTEIYVVASLSHSGHTDSIFATATLTPPVSPLTVPTLGWGPTTVVCDIEFVTLATHNLQVNKLFAIGRSATPAAQGLYCFTLPTIPLVPPVKVNFNATGLFAIDTDGVTAVATAHSNPAILTGVFTNLRKIDLNTFANSVPPAFTVLGRNDYDDLAVANGRVYVTGINGMNANMFPFTLATGTAQTPVMLAPPSIWRLSVMPNSHQIFVVDANTYRGAVYNSSSGTFINNFLIPLQIMPVALAARADETEVYALNMFSNTVNAVKLNALIAAPPSFTNYPAVTLASYRAQMLASFTDLTGVLLQYFKDSWCDLFLVECPKCTEDDKVYLGTIQIKGKKVFEIRNFSKRHYAKSFRTWGYWLSAFPLLTVVKRLFAKFASTTLVP